MAAAGGLGRFVPWFYAAALYNLAWGSFVALFPQPIVDLGGPQADTVLLRVVALFVLVYAPAYWWVARRPEGHAHLVAVALLGKLLGTAGFVAAVAADALPITFGVVVLANDVVWLPAFALYLRGAARQLGGWRVLFAG